MGLFKCSFEDHELDTDDIIEMREHFQVLEHNYVGNGECEQCGKPLTVDMTCKVKVSRQSPLLLCEDCKA